MYAIRSYYAFAAVQVVVEALKKVEAASKKKITAMDLAAVRVELNKALRTGSYITTLGDISMDPQGEVVQKDFYVSQIKISYNFV